MTKKTFRTLLMASLLGMAGASQAGLVLSNITYSSTQLSLRVTGTVTATDLNNSDLDSLFFGFDNGGNNAWITSVDGTASSALDNKLGGSYTVSNGGSNDLNGSSSLGGYLYTNSAGTIGVGTTIDYELSWVGNFNFAQFVPTSSLVVQVGYKSYPPVIGGAQNVLAGTAQQQGQVPEPSALLLAGAALLALGATRRRRA